jgi:hypothetical protein
MKVIHTIDKRIYFDIPLYHEQGMKIDKVVVEAGRLVIVAVKSESALKNILSVK